MQKEINLLPHKNQGLLQKEQTIMVVRAIAIFSVVIVLSSYVGVLLLGRNYSLSDAQAQQASMHARLRLLQDKSAQELFILDRVNRIQTILKTRSSLIATISTLQNEVSEDVTIRTIDVTNKSAAMAVSSPSLASLKGFIDSLTLLVNKKKLFQKITINNVVVDSKTGMYSVSIQGVLL